MQQEGRGLKLEAQPYVNTLLRFEFEVGMVYMIVFFKACKCLSKPLRESASEENQYKTLAIHRSQAGV